MKKKVTTPYAVEKGIPMERKKSISARFPFDKMKVGDSFYVPKEDQDPLKLSISIYSAANSYNKTHGAKLRVATRKDENGTRVWRIEDKK